MDQTIESTEVLGVYTGSIKPFGDDQRPSGMVKSLRRDSVRVTRLGLSGDQQADRRVHGGAEKAVMQFSSDNYQTLRTAFPEKSAQFVIGTLGENIAASSFNESNVHIGDVFRLGSAMIQVSQPRKPCWKIDQRVGIPKLSVFVSEHGIAGWYYRVLQEGAVRTGDPLQRVETPNEGITIRALWTLYLSHRPDLDSLQHAAGQAALAPEWQQQLAARLKWLHKHSATENNSR